MFNEIYLENLIYFLFCILLDKIISDAVIRINNMIIVEIYLCLVKDLIYFLLRTRANCFF